MAVKIGKIIQAPNLALTLIRNATLWITEKLGLQMVPKSMSQQSIGPGFFSKSAIMPEKHRRPFPQPLVSHRQGGEPVLMDSFLGDQFTLLSRIASSNDVSHPLISHVEVAGPKTEPTGDSETKRIIDVDGVLANWLDEVKADAVLLRPD